VVVGGLALGSEVGAEGTTEASEARRSYHDLVPARAMTGQQGAEYHRRRNATGAGLRGGCGAICGQGRIQLGNKRGAIRMHGIRHGREGQADAR
jgi:hypothetical protein